MEFNVNDHTFGAPAGDYVRHPILEGDVKLHNPVDVINENTNLGIAVSREDIDGFLDDFRQQRGDRFTLDYNTVEELGGLAGMFELADINGLRMVVELDNMFTFPLNWINIISMDRLFNLVLAYDGQINVGSDAEQIYEWTQGPNPMMTIRLQQIGRLPRSNNRNSRTRRRGRWWTYYVDGLPGVDWENLGIMHRDAVDKEPCFYKALRVEGLPEKKLNKLKTLMVSMQMSSEKIGHLCRVLNIRINLHKMIQYQGKEEGTVQFKKVEKQRYGGKHDQSSNSKRVRDSYDNLPEEEKKTYQIGYINSHFYGYTQRTGVTKWALQKLEEETKKDPNWVPTESNWQPMMSAPPCTPNRNRVSEVKPYDLFKWLMKHQENKTLTNIIKPVTLTRETLDFLDWKKFDTVFKVYKTLEYDKDDTMPYGERPSRDKEEVTVTSRKRKRGNDVGDDEKEYLMIAFDFETTTDGMKHEPYLVSWTIVPSKQQVDRYADEPETIRQLFFKTYTNTGRNCGGDMVRMISHNFYSRDKHKGVCLIAHNLSYDIRFLFQYINTADPMPKLIENGGNVKSISFGYVPYYRGVPYSKAKPVHFMAIDSYAFISSPLSKFPKMFHLDNNMSKEIMPYSVYNEENMSREKPFCYIEEFVQESIRQELLKNTKLRYAVHFGIQGVTEEHKRMFSDDVRDQVMQNVTNWNCWIEGKEDTAVDIVKYAQVYCERDVEILAKGWVKFRQLVYDALDGLNIDCVSGGSKPYVSINQVAQAYLKNRGCFKECYWFTGIPRDFLQTQIVGGKCMLAFNDKQTMQDQPIADFDACSLYPSSMTTLEHRGQKGFLKGKPKVLHIDDTVDYLSNFYEHKVRHVDGVFVRVRVVSVAPDIRRRRFPVLTYVDRDRDVRIFSDGQDLVNREMTLDTFTIKNVVESYRPLSFQVRFIQGYYFDEGRNPTICNVMQELYDLRRQYKKKKNPIQVVLKLIMNGSYGRSILKPIRLTERFLVNQHIYDKESRKYKKYAKANSKFFQENWDRIINYQQFADDEDLKAGSYRGMFSHRVQVLKDVNEHYNAPHVGGEILSNSKLIMSRVMHLAEDLGIEIAYMDTDSMHIYKESVPLLAEKFKEKYNKELIGNQTGQFHSDFDFTDFSSGYSRLFKDVTNNGKIDDSKLHSKQFIGVGKKAYMDKLEYGIDQKITSYHFRLKGVPANSILHYCIENNICLEDLYASLHRGETHEFNLTAVHPRFKKHKNMTVSSVVDFCRKVKF